MVSTIFTRTRILRVFFTFFDVLWELRSSEFKLMFIPASALLVMHSIYIGQLLRPAAAPLTICMRVCLGSVSMVCNYPHPAVQFNFTSCRLNLISHNNIFCLMWTKFSKISAKNESLVIKCYWSENFKELHSWKDTYGLAHGLLSWNFCISSSKSIIFSRAVVNSIAL